MPFELKTEFEPQEDVIAYLKGDVLTELQRLQTVESEAEAEKARIISKPEYNLINADHFWKLHGDRLRLDDQGVLSIDRSDLGEFKQQTPAQYVEDIAQQPSEQHLFKPKGGRGNDSPGAGDSPSTTPTNPWKKEEL